MIPSFLELTNSLGGNKTNIRVTVIIAGVRNDEVFFAPVQQTFVFMDEEQINGFVRGGGEA